MDAPYFHQIIPELTSYLRNRVDQHAHRASGRDNNRRVVVGICGFDRSFRYGGGDTAEEALTALPIFLNDEWAGVLYEAMTTLGVWYPSDPGVHELLLESSAAEDRLNSLAYLIHELEATAGTDAHLSEALSKLRR